MSSQSLSRAAMFPGQRRLSRFPAVPPCGRPSIAHRCRSAVRSLPLATRSLWPPGRPLRSSGCRCDRLSVSAFVPTSPRSGLLPVRCGSARRLVSARGCGISGHVGLRRRLVRLLQRPYCRKQRLLLVACDLRAKSLPSSNASASIEFNPSLASRSIVFVVTFCPEAHSRSSTSAVSSVSVMLQGITRGGAATKLIKP